MTLLVGESGLLFPVAAGRGAGASTARSAARSDPRPGRAATPARRAGYSTKKRKSSLTAWINVAGQVLGPDGAAGDVPWCGLALCCPDVP